MKLSSASFFRHVLTASLRSTLTTLSVFVSLFCFFEATAAVGQSSPCGSNPSCQVFPYYDLRYADNFSSNYVMLGNASSNSIASTISSPFYGPQTTSVPAASTSYLELGSDVAGGPVFVNGSDTTPASQRIITGANDFPGSFTEFYAQPVANASSQLWLNWYDQYNPGYSEDVHVVNVNSSPVTATVSFGTNSNSFTVPAFGDAYTNFPGQVGGPVSISATGPVLASGRTIYASQGFNEVAAVSSNYAGTDIMFPWYDEYNAHYNADEIHISNAGTSSATVTVTLSGVVRAYTTITPGTEYGINFRGVYGGGLRITSTSPVIVSQRVQYGQSFNEVFGKPTSMASTALMLNWYDNYNTGYTEYVHLANPSTSTAYVSVFLNGTTNFLTLGAGGTAYTNFPGQYGGPVMITSSVPILATGRTNYNADPYTSESSDAYDGLSFSEVYAVPIP